MSFLPKEITPKLPSLRLEPIRPTRSQMFSLHCNTPNQLSYGATHAHTRIHTYNIHTCNINTNSYLKTAQIPWYSTHTCTQTHTHAMQARNAGTHARKQAHMHLCTFTADTNNSLLSVFELLAENMTLTPKRQSIIVP